MSFASLGLSAPLLKAIEKQGYTTPTPIQQQAIPAVLEGRDVMAAAQTGTGKTAGFTLPLLERLANKAPVEGNQVRCLVLTPTRELAAQVSESIATYGANLPLRSAVVFGGVKINPQIALMRRGVDILVATPGRLLDLYNQNAVKFNNLEILVLDEADRMLDMGFINDIKKVLKVLPKKRQNLLFSATFSDDIRTLAKGLVNDPVEISVTPRNATANTVKQWIHCVDKKEKGDLLVQLIKDNKWHQVLVFTRTKHGANKLTKQLNEAGITAAAIHGNKSQGARTKALAEFKQNVTRILVATDIAARGLDIEQLPQVVNFDLPNVAEDYVHRIGRTGRAGASGHAVSLVAADEVDQLIAIERLIQKVLERRHIDGFEANHMVPITTLDSRPMKAKKPSRGGQNNVSAPVSRNKGRGRGGNGSNLPRANKSENKGGKENRSPAKPAVSATKDGLRSQPMSPRRRPANKAS
ncbi:DEAD/DEAH box helicase [Marinomonas algicola]|uniref:DEAD/DEAH box helicase n=1 Tax=Marinomonas algicola TaxID=2773454 RepID=UPI00174E52CD|nr:DEAD/DEAH box helicase [Marinomonas algicola]